MGGSPGSSARCAQCRQKRRKCGLETPSCVRCVKAGTECSGPIDSRTYVNLNAGNIHRQTNRKNLHTAFAERHQSVRYRQDTCSKEIQLKADTTTVTVVSLPNGKSSHSLNNIAIHTFYVSLTDEFKPRLKVGIFSGDRNRLGGPIYSSMATGIRALLPYTSHGNKLLDLSIHTLLTRYLGAFREDDKLVNLARSSYTSALGEFHKHMCSMEHISQTKLQVDHISRALLCLCLALLLFEMVDQPVSKEACAVHVDGALKVLQVTGPTIYQQDEGFQHTFSGLRGLVIPIAIRRRQKIFLEDKSWLDIPFTFVEKTRQAKLHDLAIRIPGLIEQTDTIIASQHTDPFIIGNAIALKINYLSLRQEFFDWFNHIVIDDHGPIYWHTKDDQYIKSEEDPVCIPHLNPETRKISFRDGPRAGLLAHYWAYRLELVMGMLDLYKIETDDQVQWLDSVPGLDVSSCLREANVLAQMIFETVPYLSSCLEGRITMQGPLDTISRYHERMGLHM